MLIKSIEIFNLYSFEHATLFLGKHNVITGLNGAGKSNIIRILKRLVHDKGYGFSVSYIEDHEKFNKKNNSWIKMSILFSDEESELISKFIFGKSIKKFPLPVDFYILWEGSRENQKIKTALVLQEKLIIWKDESDKVSLIENDKFSSENIFNSLDTLEWMSIGGRNNNKIDNIFTNNNFIQLLIEDPSKIDITKLIPKNTYDLFNKDSKKIDKEIFDYCNLDSVRNNVDLWILLVKILSKNFIFLKEFRPTIQELKIKINNKKSQSRIQNIVNLQRDFSDIFPGYTFEIDGDEQINFLIGKCDHEGLLIKDQSFKLENSASGFFEILYMLNELQSDNKNIIILDEPALHLHPIKQKHFWQNLVGKTDNQVIIITHSPYLVNLFLFQGDNKLINVQMKNGKSEIYPSKSEGSPIRLRDYNFRPEIFFSKCNILVEGPGDEAAIAAISDSLDHLFEKYSIQLINVGGKDVLESYVPLLNEYDIPHVALADYDYNCDDERKIPRERDKTNDFVILKKRLEEELYEFDKSVNIMTNFDSSNPCKTSREDQPKSIRPKRAYDIIKRAMSDNKQMVRKSKLWEVVQHSLSKAEINFDH